MLCLPESSVMSVMRSPRKNPPTSLLSTNLTPGFRLLGNSNYLSADSGAC